MVYPSTSESKPSRPRYSTGVDLDRLDFVPAFRRTSDFSDPGRVDFVKSQVASLFHKDKGKFSFILCPYHSEKTPSGRVSHDPSRPSSAGNFRCYGCNAQARWNDLATLLGVETFPDYAPDPSREVALPTLSKTRFAGLLSQDPGEDQLEFFPLTSKSMREELELKSSWRSFSFDFLETVGAKFVRVTRGNWSRSYVYLPVLVSGVERGYIKAQPRKPDDKSVPSYINKPGHWSKSFGLFPYDAAVALMREKGLSTLVVVEGPRDALRLLSLGYPAVCILGTHSWTDSKIRLLQLTEATRIVLCLDGDDAGEKATKLLYSGMREGSPPQRVAKPLTEFFEVKRVHLSRIDPQPEGNSKYDPGNVPAELLQPILDRLVR